MNNIIKIPMTKEEVRTAVYELFKQEAMDKEEYRRKSRTDERPMLPWSHYSLGELFVWFKKEVEELEKAMKGGDPAEISDECLDVSNFATFIWAYVRFKGRVNE